ncbi:biotin transporter BioY [Fusibacter bizertensis]|uniref:Biotin transporter n=1 Tax=Fusibacter bizertensis TaxID=1488331 RepID=A0ABT6N8N0_9FIRM|nr:biotin transporter BioY [Fusibacter bizertensis]MDH8676772.1 biotin transporter BioY [Fusibacter bizertensis]
MKLTTRDLTMIPLFTALMFVGAKVSIPFSAVPITFQLFFSVFAGLLLGARNGLISQLLYIGMGLIGIPVFTYGGGFQYIFNPTFGYLIGFAGCALIVGTLAERTKVVNFTKLLGFATLGLVFTYAFGNVYFYMIKNIYVGTPMALSAIFKMMIPYMIKDYVLLIIAAYVSALLIPRLKKAGIYKVKEMA